MTPDISSGAMSTKQHITVIPDEALMNDEFNGIGGSYIFNAAGVRVPADQGVAIEDAAPAPIDPPIDPVVIE